MTTIACDGNMMAGDGKITDNDIVSMLDCQKVRRLKDGRLVGFCGNAYNYDAFVEWLEADGGDLPKIEDQFGCLVLNTDGSLVSYDQHGRAFAEKAPWAIGSGMRFAIAAMDLGKSPDEAIAYACTRDIYSGGAITALTIEPVVRAVA